MKHFLLFAGDRHYPGGGWHDFVSDYDTLEEAEKEGKKNDEKDIAGVICSRWWHIVDTKEKKIL